MVREGKTRTEQSQRNDGQLSLALSRFFPGTRLPAYISAGLDRMPGVHLRGDHGGSAIRLDPAGVATIQLAPREAVSRNSNYPY